MNITDFINKGEGKTLEYKRDLSSLKNIIKTIVAFANTSGGKILVGIEDKTKTVLGISDEESLYGDEKITNSIYNNIQPQIIPEISFVEYLGNQIMVIDVFPGSKKPYYIKSIGVKNGTYIRFSSTNRVASSDIIEELARSTRNISFDKEIFYDGKVESIDMKYIKNLFKEKNREISNISLMNLGILKEESGEIYPTVGGYILFGKERNKYFPDAVIRCARFKGKGSEEFLDMQDFAGYPIKEIDYVISFIKRNINKSARIDGVYREESYEFPILALREGLINAIVHRDYAIQGSDIKVGIYDDRIEIISPGMLPFGVVFEDILEGVSHLRNKVIGMVFKELGLIEQWGTGIKRMISECKKMDLKAPLLEERGNFFKVTIFNKAKNTDVVALDEESRIIIENLKQNKALTNIEITKLIDKSIRTVRIKMKELIQKDFVEEIAKNVNDPTKYYVIKERIH